MTKAELNDRLRNPLLPSKLKKTPIADLEAMVAKEQTAPKPTPDRVLFEPRPAAEVSPTRAGTKRHAIIAALHRGCTIDDLVAATGWRRDVADAAMRYDVRQIGLGVERREGKFWLLLPEGMKNLPVVKSGETRADALVAACK